MIRTIQFYAAAIALLCFAASYGLHRDTKPVDVPTHYGDRMLVAECGEVAAYLARASYESAYAMRCEVRILGE